MRGYTQAAVVDRAGGRLIGRGGLWRPEGWPAPEVGWMLERAAWGQGLASELGRAARNLAFGTLARYEGETTVAGLPCLIYGQGRAT